MFNPGPLLVTMIRSENTLSMNVAPDLYSETEFIPQQMHTDSPLHRLSYVLGTKQQRQGHKVNLYPNKIKSALVLAEPLITI